MWYFDKLQRSYPKRDQKLTRELLNLNSLSSGEDQPQLNPLYEVGKNLRDNCLAEYKDKFLNSPYEVLIHLPPTSISPGGNSLFHNMGESFKHLGIAVRYFWDNLPEIKFDNSKVYLVLTSFNEVYRKRMDWELISKLENKNKLYIGSTFPFHHHSIADIPSDLQVWLKADNRFLYSFYNEKFVMDSVIGKYALSENRRIYSIEFGANPLYHFPDKYINHCTDYIFLGSANHDKIGRYYQYFHNAFKQFKGVVAGPGWDWITDYEIKPGRDRFLYSKAKVAINLHIDMQISNPCELNERTYILAACGIPQVVDRPLLLDSYFVKVGHVANNPEEYINSIEHVLKNYDEAIQCAENAMIEVFEKHTTFSRIDKLLKNIALD